ncbi:calmodulin-binding transcription activator 3-like isoform X2 [Dioscorea cayenensis subsp. rotundata]|uniref:Calmodulin-binding transcription activator 3-like isoform X2 n=1 Tax=Dioscorea cayennensis subsp. rotundata TaxID=55577 RepID=A0AB40D1C9_DIOCR|nr:calmodulin-binding transcription activator 3-like isoform X2 [Dioscorea cayenensis subsp. rotundata]
MAETRRYAINPQLDINQIILEAQQRWLRPAEICEILRNYQNFCIAPEPPNKPPSGSLFLFDRKVLRYFRKDGHNWRKKKDGKTVKEAHERLKSGSVDVLHCYYAHGEENENFQRRSYWMLEEDLMHIVLVHYREVKGNKSSYRSIREVEDNSQVTQLDSSVISNSFTHRSRLLSQTTEAESANSTQTSELEDAESDNYQASSRYHSYPDLQRCADEPVIDARLFNHYVPFHPPDDQFHFQKPHVGSLESGFYSVSQGDNTKAYDRTSLGLTFNAARTQFDSTCWNELLDHCTTGFDDPIFRPPVASTDPASLENNFVKESLILGGLGTDDFNFKHDVVAISQDQLIFQGSNAEIGSLPKLDVDLKAEHLPEGIDYDSCNRKSQSLDLANIGEGGLKKHDSFSRWMSNELGEVEDPCIKSSSGVYWGTVDNGNVEVSSLSTQDLLETYLMPPSLSQDQLFSIIDFSPNWAYIGSETKVLVTGKFLKDKEDVDKCKWSCMFGEIEVRAEILAEGVLRCIAPLHASGRVPFYITCSNRLACSEVREFEYRLSDVQHMEISDSYLCSTHELNLHIRLERLLSLESASHSKPLSSVLTEKHDLSSKISSLLMESEDEWCNLLKLNQDKRISPGNAKNHLLEKLLKDKLHTWLLHKLAEDGKGPSVLDSEGQGVLHLAAALGYDWAIEPTITAGVSINFRDVHGWTALHWAAFCGRERTVVTLIVLGADPGALTDPTPEFPTGRTASDLASTNNHKGIGGFLAESSLTNHLSMLKLKESEGNDVSEISGLSSIDDVVAESVAHLADGEEHAAVSMKDCLSALRNSALAAAQIHQVFRVQSFQRKKLVEFGDDKCGTSHERVISLLSLKPSRLGQQDLPLNAAAIKIQNKFRGWKDRKEFMVIRKRIVIIQAHVRGHQVRKHYKKVVWTVGIVEKAILRWRRKGSGLRGFRSENLLEGSMMQDQSSTEDEYDYLKEGRKQTEARFGKALARVRSMVQYSEARDQYHRLLKVVTELQESKVMQESLLNGPVDGGDFMTELEELWEDSPLPLGPA